jgi:hypothetical protein
MNDGGHSVGQAAMPYGCGHADGMRQQEPVELIDLALP